METIHETRHIGIVMVINKGGVPVLVTGTLDMDITALDRCEPEMAGYHYVMSQINLCRKTVEELRDPMVAQQLVVDWIVCNGAPAEDSGFVIYIDDEKVRMRVEPLDVMRSQTGREFT